MGHLTIAERLQIEHGLKNRCSLKEIGKSLGKAVSTISREIRKNSMPSEKGAQGRVLNRCVQRRNCSKKHLCANRCLRQCSACSRCNKVCADFIEEKCPALSIPPYVCNGCAKECRCVLRKCFYLHSPAEKSYRKRLTENRQGINLSEMERIELRSIIYEGLKKGQSIHHMAHANKDEFRVCEKSIYRYVNTGIFGIPGRSDLPRAMSLKPRKSKKVEHKVDTKCRTGRALADFHEFCKTNPDTPVVEMDSVLGGVGGKVLLTLNFNNCSLMLAFLRPSNTSQSVIDIFDQLEQTLGLNTFKQLFPVILTDNGSEFSNPLRLEFSPFHHSRRSRIFYCDPYSSYQKGRIENNHLNLRKIFPKGSSFKEYTQQNVNLALSHINSFARKSLNDIPAITLFKTLYGEKILQKLEINLIRANEICLTPDLLKK